MGLRTSRAVKGLNPGTLVELVRLPAVLSVPGDTLLGASAGGKPIAFRRALGLAGSSSLLYLAGMALNDYADRDIDAEERPHRPIPSGRIDATTALRIAQGLTAGGILLAGIAGGKRSAAVAGLLAADIWAYDMALKNTPLGPLCMASCRSLDVLMGAGNGAVTKAIAPAVTVGAHILAVTSVSKFEVQGATSRLAKVALAACAAVTVNSAALIAKRTRHKRGPLAISAVGLATYILPLAQAARIAIDKPEPRQLQRLVGTGVLGVVPLQSALISGSGRPSIATGVGALWPLARHFSRKRSVT